MKIRKVKARVEGAGKNLGMIPDDWPAGKFRGYRLTSRI